MRIYDLGRQAFDGYDNNTVRYDFEKKVYASEGNNLQYAGNTSGTVPPKRNTEMRELFRKDRLERR